MKLILATALLVLVQVYQSASQVPPRLQIPGAFAVGGPPPQQHAPPRRIPIRQQQQQQQQQQHQQPLFREDIPLPLRVRRPQQNALPTLQREQPIRHEVRPVVEEHEEPERPAPQPHHTLRLDEEVARFAAAHEERERQRQVVEEPDTERPAQQYAPQPIVFRPAPKAISQDDFREIPRPLPQQPIRQVVRQQLRPVVQQEQPIPVRKAPVQQAPRRQQQAAPVPIAARRPNVEYDEDDEHQRRRKPTAQILRKYREDNPDGSITWGYENDDGSFKEENIGIDCITRGKYGYVDPDGVRREFAYETGNKCDKVAEAAAEAEEERLEYEQHQLKNSKRPHPLRI